jgi:hypothetical protein
VLTGSDIPDRIKASKHMLASGVSIKVYDGGYTPSPGAANGGIILAGLTAGLTAGSVNDIGAGTFRFFGASSPQAEAQIKAKIPYVTKFFIQ